LKMLGSQFDAYKNYEPKWVPCSGNSIPPNAFVGGKDSDGQVLYVARAFIHGSVQPGKAGRDMNPPGAHIPWDGKEHINNDYDVLILPMGSEHYYKWIPATEGVTTIVNMKRDGHIMPVVGGYEPDGRELYIAQCFNDDYHGRSIHPGKFGIHTSAGLYAYGGKEKHASSFDILVFDTSMVPSRGGSAPNPQASAVPGSTGQGSAGYNQNPGSGAPSNFSGSQFSAPTPGGGFMTAQAGYGVPGGSAVSYGQAPPNQPYGYPAVGNLSHSGDSEHHCHRDHHHH
jgi:hypothetical protein